MLQSIRLIDPRNHLNKWKLSFLSHCRKDPQDVVFLTLQRDRSPRVILEGPEEIQQLSAVLCAKNEQGTAILDDCVKINNQQIKFKKMSFKELKSKMGPLKSNEVSFYLDIQINGVSYRTEPFRIESRVPLKRKSEGNEDQRAKLQRKN